MLEAARGWCQGCLSASVSLDDDQVCCSWTTAESVFLLLEGTPGRDGGRSFAFEEKPERLPVSCIGPPEHPLVAYTYVHARPAPYLWLTVSPRTVHSQCFSEWCGRAAGPLRTISSTLLS